MAFDRKKVKATSVSAMKDADKQLKKQLGKNERADKIELEEGTNLLRIYPPHPEDMGGGTLFAEPVVMTYLPAIVQEKDKEGNLLYLDAAKKQPKMKEGVKPVFNAKIHGPQEPDEVGGMKSICGKDLVEEYIKGVLNRATELYGKDKKNASREAFLEPIFGNFAKNVNGITYQPKWICYAELLDEKTLSVKKFGDWEFKKSIHDRLQAIATMEAASDPMGTDPFTDIDEGRGVRVLYNPNASQAKDYYTTEIDTTQVPVPGQPKLKSTRTFPLTDKQLDAWAAMTPLAKRFKGSFSLKDLKLQITGLELFDTKHKFGVFDTDEFQALIGEISELFPDTGDESDTVNTDDLPFTVDEKETGSLGKDDDTDDEQTEGEDVFSLMSRAEMIAYNKKERCGLAIKATMQDDDVRVALRAWKQAVEGGEDEDESQGTAVDDIANGPALDESVEVYKAGDKGKKADPKAKENANKDLAAMKNRLRGKK